MSDVSLILVPYCFRAGPLQFLSYRLPFRISSVPFTKTEVIFEIGSNRTSIQASSAALQLHQTGHSFTVQHFQVASGSRTVSALHAPWENVRGIITCQF